nr:MAG TPA: hypothetical protein [Caudoviricetes sp.]
MNQKIHFRRLAGKKVGGGQKNITNILLWMLVNLRIDFYKNLCDNKTYKLP